jgi:hypothetical protein
MTAVSSAELSATEIALAAADKPILGANAAKVANLGSQTRWTATTSGVHDTTSISDTDTPVSRIFDGLPPIRSAPTSTQNNYTIFLEFDSVITFDGILYLDHNLQSEGCTALVLQVGDDEDMTNATTISTLDPSGESTNKRLADLVLESGGGVARRYTADYMRVTMAKGSGFDPVIGQIVFLRRRQLPRQPRMSWDPTNQESGIDRFKTRSNIKHDTVRYRGARMIQAEHRFDTSDEHTAILNWWDNTNQGTEPVIWIDEPNAAPADFFFGLIEPTLAFPYTMPTTREFRLVAEEQPPHLELGL